MSARSWKQAHARLMGTPRAAPAPAVSSPPAAAQASPSPAVQFVPVMVPVPVFIPFAVSVAPVPAVNRGGRGSVQARRGSSEALGEVVALVCSYWGVHPNVVFSDDRDRFVCQVRKTCYWMAYRLTAAKFPQIAEAFNRTHASVIRSIAVFEKEMRRDPALSAAVDNLVMRLMEPVNAGSVRVSVRAPGGTSATQWEAAEVGVLDCGIGQGAPVSPETHEEISGTRG